MNLSDTYTEWFDENYQQQTSLNVHMSK